MIKVKATVGMYQATSVCETEVEGKIITVEEYDEVLRVKENEIKNSNDDFRDFLEVNYTTDELWDMDEQEKQRVKAKFEEYCKEKASECLIDEWDYFEIYTEVVISDKEFAEIAPKKAKAKCPCPCNQ